MAAAATCKVVKVLLLLYVLCLFSNPRRKPEKQSILSYLNWQDLFCLKKFYEMLLDSPTHSICQIGLQDSALALSEEGFDASFCSSISRTSKSSYRLARVQNRKKKDSVIITYVLYSQCVVRNSRIVQNLFF